MPVAALLHIRASFARSFAHRGRLGTLAFVAYYPFLKLRQRLVKLTPGWRKWHAAQHAQDIAFDAAHGVDTSGRLYPELDEALGKNRFYGNFYLAIQAEEFREAMARIPITHRDYVFIDYGSGKGRALLLAVEWGFNRIIGIEYSAALHTVALQNAAHYTQAQQHSIPFELHCMDAVEYALYPLPTVVFMHNPFGEPVVAQVLLAIRQSLITQPRDLWIMYHYPLARAPFLAADFLTCVYHCEAYEIYRANPPQLA